ncbi:Werner helicase interacting protein 1 [Nowakowskiella sp. JEL0078]|nr:Werner helicase interacting protein 1 [Nowakowskiella sp. JEL0078]
METQVIKKKTQTAPLSELARPSSLDELFGQLAIVGPNSMLRGLIQQSKTPSMVLWGPPGSGKTTIGRIIAKLQNSFYREMSAVTHTIADIRKFGDESKNHRKLNPNQKPILFMDEIHRFTKAQQDIFLPLLESGIFTLIAATTENPSFRITPALLSRCKVFILEKLQPSDILPLLIRAARIKLQPLEIDLHILGDSDFTPTSCDANKGAVVRIDISVLKVLSRLCDGDARNAINTLDMVLDSSLLKMERDNVIIGNVVQEEVKEILQKSHLMHDEEEHYNLISALHKSVRGGDENAALYWLGRIIYAGDDPLYVARRLIRMASEDIGLADSSALPLAVSTYEACRNLGMPECDVILAHCVMYLTRAPKSVQVYRAIKRVKETIENEVAFPVPLHIRNAPTKLMSDSGYSEGYKYNPDYLEPVQQNYLPDQLLGKKFVGVVYGPEIFLENTEDLNK